MRLIDILIATVVLAVPDIIIKWQGRKECAKRFVQDSFVPLKYKQYPLHLSKYKRCPMWDFYAYEHCPHGGLYEKNT